MDLDFFELDGMTPETNMSEEKSDINTFFEFRWYQWVYFRDTYVTFPRDMVALGSSYGPNIDVGPALTAKILRNNGQQVHRSTYRALPPDELVNPDEMKACDEFDTVVGEKLCPAASAEAFESDRILLHQILISSGFTNPSGVNAIYVYLWTCCPLFLRILEVSVGPTSIIKPQYLPMTNLSPGKVTDVPLK